MGVAILQPAATMTLTPEYKVHRVLSKLPRVLIGCNAPRVQRILPNVPNTKSGTIKPTNGENASRLLPKVPAPPSQPQTQVTAKHTRSPPDVSKTNTVKKDTTKVHPRVLPKIRNTSTNGRPKRDREAYMHGKNKNEGDSLFRKGMHSYNAALQQKGELLFAQCNYEKALVFHHRGSRQRSDMICFQQGITKSQQTLDDSNNGRKQKTTAAGGISTFASSMKKETKKNPTETSSRNNGSNESPTLVSLRHVKPSTKKGRPKVKESKKDTTGSLSVNPSSTGSREQLGPKQMEESNINNNTMKNILGRMNRDKEYLEKLVTRNEESPNSVNLQAMAENGLSFVYDRVLNLVRQGQTFPADVKIPTSYQPIRPISSETRSNESEKNRERKTKEVDDKGNMHPSSWFRCPGRRNVAEAAERKANRHTFATVVEGQKIPLSVCSDHVRKVLGPIKTKEKKARADKRTKLPKREKDDRETIETENSALSFNFSTNRISTHLEGVIPGNITAVKTEPEANEHDKAPPTKLWKYMKQEKRPSVGPELSKREMIDNYISRGMEDIELAYADRQPEECRNRARAMLTTTEGISEEDLPNRFAVAAKLHSYIGNAAIELKDLNVALRHHRTDLEIGEKCNMDEITSRALGNIGRIFVFENRHREALHMYLRKVPLCKTRMETVWLFHEIGNCYLVLGEYEYAKEAARRSLEEAEEAVEGSYQLQACVLMGVSEVKLKQYHIAFNTFERALDQAKVQGDTQAEIAIHEALKDVNDRIAVESRSKTEVDYRRPSRGGIAKSRAEFSDYSSIFIPEDDGDVSLTETGYDTDNLNLDLDQLRLDVETSCFGSVDVPSEYRQSRNSQRSDRRQSTIPLS